MSPPRPLVVFVPAQLTRAWCFERVASLIGSDAEIAHVEPAEADARISAEDALDAYEQRVERAVEQGSGRRVVLVGASLGAYIAARVATRAGSGIAHLVLVGGLARMPAELSRFRMEIADRLARGDAATSDVIAATAASVVEADELTAELKALLARELGAFTRDDLIWHLRATAPMTTEARAVGRYDVPTTVLHGRRDQAVPFACGEALAALGSRARFEALETSSHLPSLTHPDEVASRLL